MSDGNLVGRACDWSGFVVGWECGFVEMRSWDGNVLFVMVRMCVAWDVFWDEWICGNVCLTRMVVRF